MVIWALNTSTYILRTYLQYYSIHTININMTTSSIRPIHGVYSAVLPEYYDNTNYCTVELYLQYTECVGQSVQ